MRSTGRWGLFLALAVMAAPAFADTTRATAVRRTPETPAPAQPPADSWQAQVKDLEARLKELRDRLRTELEPLQGQIKTLKDKLEPEIQQMQDQVKGMVEQHKSPGIQELDRQEEAELAALADREKAEEGKLKDRFTEERKAIQQKYAERRGQAHAEKKTRQ